MTARLRVQKWCGYPGSKSGISSQTKHKFGILPQASARSLETPFRLAHVAIYPFMLRNRRTTTMPLCSQLTEKNQNQKYFLYRASNDLNLVSPIVATKS